MGLLGVQVFISKGAIERSTPRSWRCKLPAVHGELGVNYMHLI